MGGDRRHRRRHWAGVGGRADRGLLLAGRLHCQYLSSSRRFGLGCPAGPGEQGPLLPAPRPARGRAVHCRHDYLGLRDHTSPLRWLDRSDGGRRLRRHRGAGGRLRGPRASLSISPAQPAPLPAPAFHGRRRGARPLLLRTLRHDVRHDAIPAVCERAFPVGSGRVNASHRGGVPHRRAGWTAPEREDWHQGFGDLGPA